MDAYERSWLQQEGIVPVGRADLGLTALKTDDVMKLLQQDYPEIHIALTDLFRRRKFKMAVENQKRQYEVSLNSRNHFLDQIASTLQFLTNTAPSCDFFRQIWLK